MRHLARAPKQFDVIVTSNIFGDIPSAAMMLRYTFGLMEEADAIESAVEKVLNDGYRTPDIAKEGEKARGTEEAGDLIVEAIN